MPDLRATLREPNRAALARLDLTGRIDVDLAPADGRPILLLDTITPTTSPTVISVHSTHDTREQALASITDDGVNVLPSLLVDLDSDNTPVTIITYDPVHGMQERERFPLPAGEADELAEYAAALLHALDAD